MYGSKGGNFRNAMTSTQVEPNLSLGDENPTSDSNANDGKPGLLDGGGRKTGQDNEMLLASN
eukprot:scaffold416458_cov15-Prasinocladus_malaysianus.AAC.1